MGRADLGGVGAVRHLEPARVGRKSEGGEGEREGDSEFPVVSGFLPNWKLRHVPFGLSFW